jgi:hypothetical protein
VKLWVKILIVVFVVIVLVIGVAAVKVLGPRAFLGPRARPLTSRTFEATSARLERGKYLVHSIGCLYCHAPHDWTKHDSPMVPGMEMAGQELPFTDFPGKVVAPNLTPDKETGAGTWTDDMFARAIREGVGHDGRALFLMPYQDYKLFPDEDIASIVVYLRSLPAVHNPLPKTKLIFPVNFIIKNGPSPLTTPVPPPDLSTPEKRGHYLTHLIGCSGCHTPVDDHHNLIASMEFGGGQTFEGPWGKVASANLTPSPSGIPYYDEAMFMKTIQTGAVGSRELSQVMPWWVFRNMKDEDLKGIFAYLKTLKPVNHRVDNTMPASLCPIDKAMHGAGDQNVKQ